jgi:2-polyprenyl-3-methyl-5-hydroxy-6-metoxy-1,4-benzoquinol methylase
MDDTAAAASSRFPQNMSSSTPFALRETIPEQIELESAPCPLGCPNGDRPLFRGFDRLHGLPGQFQVVACRGCGLMRTDPRPSRGSIGFYYPDDYSPHRAVACGSATRPGWRSVLARGIDFRTAAIPPLPQGRLLEIGCGSGAFLRAMAQAGWTVNGIEPGAAAAATARSGGYEVLTGGIEDAPEPPAPYDLVVGWMVLEHLHDPVSVLRRIREWVSPDGYLVLSVPNAGALEFRLFKDAWYALQLPTHLFHFTPRSLKRVLHAGGWEIERVIHQRLLSNFAASLGYWLGDRGLLPSVARKLIEFPDSPGRQHQWFYPLAFALAVLGQTGRMTVWARPRTVSGRP